MIELEVNSEGAFSERVFGETGSVEVVDDTRTVVVRMEDETAVDWLDLILIGRGHGAEGKVVGNRNRDASVAVSDVKNKLQVALWNDDMASDSNAGDGHI